MNHTNGNAAAPTPSFESLEQRQFLSVAQHYHQDDLVANRSGVASHADTTVLIDSDMKNPWGVAFAPSGEFWLNDNGTGLSTLYDGSGAKLSLVVTVPPAAGGSSSAPTGMVYNGSNDFKVSSGGSSGASNFIFSTEDGTISGWNFGVSSDHAIITVDRSASGAVYKGLASGAVGAKNYIYATNFHSGAVDVFDKSFHLVHLAGSFHDPKVTAGYAPFGISNIGGKIFVTYAKQDSAKHDDVKGKGNGFVDVFSTAGKLIQRFAAHGSLNSPWGMAVAPKSYGKFGGSILVGNFGDGKIDAFDPKTGKLRGHLVGQNGAAVAVDGLWAITFGNGSGAGSKNALYFTAGPNEEADGLFGRITAVA